MRFFSLGDASLGGRSVALTAVAQLYLRTSRPTMGGRGAAFWSWLPHRMSWPHHSPAALRSAALIRSCQPGPSPWKKSSTSRSMRSVTCSLAFGIAGFACGSSAGLVVAALKAASAASRGSLGRRGRLVMASSLLLIALRGAEDEMAAIAEWRLLGRLAAAQGDGQVLRHGIAHRPGRG